MIKTAIVAMTVFGCDCDAKMCAFISETPAQWATVSECKAAMKSRIVNSRLDYPLITGECRTVTQSVPQLASAPIESEIIATPATLVADEDNGSAIYSGLVNGSRKVFRKTANGYSAVKAGAGWVADGAMSLIAGSAGLLTSD